jgi:YVTN family beta-propeller protein
VYVSDEPGGSVAVVDPAKAELVANIPVGMRPRGMALSRDEKQLYVAVSGSPASGPGVDAPKLPPHDRTADGIAVVDLAARKVVRVLPGGLDPEALALSPDGATLYVSNEETAELTALALSGGAIRGKASVGKEPGGVAVRPDGKTVYVACKQDNAVSVVDTTTLTTVAQLPTGKGPRSILFLKDGMTAFVSNELGRTVTVLDVGAQKSKAEIPIKEDSPMPSGVRPMGLALSPDEQLLYVSTGRGGSLAIIDTATNQQVRSIDGIGDRPWGIGLNAAGTLLYSANGTSTDLSIVNLATGNVDKRVHIGGLPWGLVVAR